jgi:hypothetical protein
MIELLCSPLGIGGLLLSFYQAYRGFMFQWYRADKPFCGWSKPRKFFLLALADGFTFFVTTASGYVSLVLVWQLWARISEPASIELGTSALVGFLAVFGILGVTGKMPHLIDTGKLSPPPFGGS